MAAQPPELPSKDKLSPMLRDFIELIESQFQILYPSAGLRTSQEFRRDPALLDIVHIIVKVARDCTPCGRYESNILLLWLGIMGTVDLDIIHLPFLFESRYILDNLYFKGVVDYSPLQISIGWPYKDIDCITATEREFVLDVSGEFRKGFGITMTPTAMATLYTHFHVNGENKSVLHKLTIVLRDQEGHGAAPAMQPIKVLVLNAGGVQNPQFSRTFSQLCGQHNPHLALVIETRLGGNEGRSRRFLFRFDASSSLEPVGYFGSQWLLWNSDI